MIINYFLIDIGIQILVFVFLLRLDAIDVLLNELSLLLNFLEHLCLELQLSFGITWMLLSKSLF